MRFETVARAFTANIALKVISLIFAVLLWLYATAQVGERQSLNVPLALAHLPESLAVVRVVPRHVEITMRGARSELLKLRFLGRVRATVELGAAHRGRLSVPITTGILNFPEWLRPEDVMIEGPKSIEVDLEPVISQYVPVKIVFTGPLPKDMALVGRPVITPDRVLVRGAALRMKGLATVETEAIDLKNERGRFSREVPLERDGPGREIIPDKVFVELEVAKRGVRAIEGIPPTLLHVEEGLEVDCSPKTATLTVEGPEELVKKLGPEDVSIILTLAVGRKGVYRIQPEVIVPQGIDAYSLNVQSFEVKVFPKR